MTQHFAVGTDGLREFRRDLRRMEPDIDRELRKKLRVEVGIVAAAAAATAPKRSGRLARSYRPFVTQRSAGVRSALPYAGVIEYGGTISPRGTAIKITRREPVTRAVEAQTNRIIDAFGDAVESAADQAGWT